MSERIDVAAFSAIPDPLGGPHPAIDPRTAEVAPADRGPTRAVLDRRKRVAVGASLVFWIAAALLLGLRADLTASWTWVLHAALPALLGAASLWAALGSGSVGLGPSARLTVGLALGAPASFVVLALLAPHHEGGEALVRGVVVCGDIGLALGAVPLAVFAWARRRTHVTAALWRSALAGVGLGLAGAGALGMHCANDDGLHVALGHGWPVVALGAVAAVLVRRATSVR